MIRSRHCSATVGLKAFFHFRRRRQARQRAASWPVAAMLCALVQLGAPVPAEAWFGWLDHLSGPGPFKGAEFDFRLMCFVDVPHWTEAARASQAAFTILDQRQVARGTWERSNPTLPANVTSDAAARSTAPIVGQAGRPVTIAELKELDIWASVIVNPPDPGNAPSRERRMVLLGEQLTQWAALIRALPDGNEAEVVSALERAASLWRGASQPRFSLMPSAVMEASCLDNPKNSRVPADAVRHGDRRPSPSFALNYRQLYANWDRSTDTPFAPGERITLRVVEPKFTWPLSGRFDFLDGQAGIGRYWFSSDGFDTLSGWIIEPVRFDLHFPARLSDGKPWWARGLMAVSYSAGMVLFPGGFPAGAFDRDGRSPQISGNEAIFVQGVVINVGRLLR
jgi:hypothetical protein